MKNMKIWIIPILSTVLNLIAIFLLPERIPIHYDIHGNADSWGPKYMVFVVLLIIYLLTILFEELVKKINRCIENCNIDEEKQKKKNLIKNIYYVGFLTECLLFLINIIMVIIPCVFLQTKSDEQQIEFIKIVIIFVSILMIIFGNYLPKCKRNSILGIRTRWSLQDDKNWNKMQKLGGKLFVMAGLINTLVGCFVDVENVLMIFFLITTILVFAIIFYPLYEKVRH
ncbi:DUF1648 domain-containing protein [Petralouisia muris]|uniref:DUF1648 domain-containing protein n=1 Tax=Petralouisia muris TaxID=3032872 RepID=A0AC61RQ86_9FIRM|nr:SdpI family protein [Petralouisia muris]TGY88732.1 DUF1648 domain-containing protein [Petralouisia muris]